jgi:hypothetical protein
MKVMTSFVRARCTRLLHTRLPEQRHSYVGANANSPPLTWNERTPDYMLELVFSQNPPKKYPNSLFHGIFQAFMDGNVRR